ncbi:hypothetical protein [Peterkaempfera bronchialis]|uniref:Uncharacterized protein n=1 Tax=Peterkaempfera bronchialis TaxID=2126346 RepID=A0A345SWF1_9ACTN|nr:hypothetical protein [Peterkaempfera bronchialis]AXI78056.1 hypothetical protein C7M71_012000 [Peterkaempfera bronchialis]
MDLLDWHRGRLSSRRLAVLVKHLPRESAITRELQGEGADWTVGDYLLAAAVDHLAAANWMFACVNTAEDSEPPEPPAPVPRPGDPPEQEADEANEGEQAGDLATASADRPSAAELVRFFT